MIAPSAFIFRDFVQYILPNIIALCLFVPFIKDDISVELLIFFGALFGYVMTSLISEEIITKIYKKLPKIEREIEKYKQERELINNRWDLEKLWYLLDEKEREYLYLTGSYTDFFRTVSFYFFLYFLINIFYFLFNFFVNIINLPMPNLCKSFKDIFLILSSLLKAICISTPLIGKLRFNTLLIILISYVLFRHTLNSYLTEYKMLFGEDGDHSNFSKKYHKEKGSLALAIWGRVFRDNKPLPNAVIELAKKDYILSTVKTNRDGQFQFADKYAECIDVTCILRVKYEGQTQKHMVMLREKQIPYIEITM